MNENNAQRNCAATERLINPFVHHLEIETTSEKIKTWILTVFLVPIRVALICFLVITGWFLATIGLMGLSEKDLREKPIEGWRKKLKNIICFIGKLSTLAGGMHYTIKGRRVTRAEAPILVAAPHSSFLDAGIVFALDTPCTISRTESGRDFHVGKIINYTQPIFVWRDDPNSRQNSIKEIIRRANSKDDWPQILIFPEGTCTNRTCLITFRSGAFYPGVPVQPVLIRYPNKLDTITWTWEGPNSFTLLWLTLCQPKTLCELEFLPVYTPSQAEKQDPKLYANNVRAVMARALGVPTVDYSYYDCKLISTAKEMNLPFAASMIDVKNLRSKLGLENSQREEQIVNTTYPCKDCNMVTFPEFCQLLNIPCNSKESQLLFQIYDREKTGRIDPRNYLLGVIGTDPEQTKYNIVRLACKMYDTSKCGRLCAEDFCRAVCQTLNLTKSYALELFDQVDRNQLGYITFQNFIYYCRRNEMFGFAITEEDHDYPHQTENGKIIKNLTPYQNSHIKKRD